MSGARGEVIPPMGTYAEAKEEVAAATSATRRAIDIPRCAPKIYYAALETTQGQIYNFFSQILYKFHQNRVASVGD